MKLRSIRDAQGLEGKTVLLRVAYDVALQKHGTGFVVAQDFRIRATIPTIQYLLKKKCRIVLLSWLKRPGGKVVEKYRMDPVARCLSGLLHKPVKKLDDCIGPKVFAEIQQLRPGQLLLLENVRFYPQEEENDRRFAKLLVHGIDLIVFDAFGQAHRVHASTTGIQRYRPTYAGFLVERELNALSRISQNPKKPLVVVLGGAKISDKVAVLEQLVRLADRVLIGGGVANVFLKAQGIPIGESFVEDIFVDKARRKKVNFVRLAKKIYHQHGDKIVLPIDMLAASRVDQKAMKEVVPLGVGETIMPNWKFLDIGPATVKNFVREIQKSKTVFWNGPMGVFEIEAFAGGTKRIAQAIGRSKTVSILGGGDTERVVNEYRLEGKFDHVSTGGGASLEFLAGKALPAIQSLFIK